MRTLLKILGVATVLFLAIGIAQNWRNFFQVGPPLAPPAVSEQTRAELLVALQKYNSMVRHAYRSGGDERFLQRIPAAPPVVERIARDIDYVRANGRVQIGETTRLDLLDVTLVGPGRAIVRTEEHWQIHFASDENGAVLEPKRTHVVFAEYRLQRGGAGWQVVWWDQTSRPDPERPAAGDH